MYADLHEKNLSEHAGFADMKIRIRKFTSWLVARPETRIILVGHSAFFRAMLGYVPVGAGAGGRAATATATRPPSRKMLWGSGASLEPVFKSPLARGALVAC